MTAKLSQTRIRELLDDPVFLLAIAEEPDAHQDEIDEINAYLRATTAPLPTNVSQAAPAAFKYLGTRVRRIEDPARLTGQAIYVSDIKLPGMLHAAILGSPHAHALIQSIDTSQAEKLPGVHLVLTYKNAPNKKLGGPPDQYLLQQETHTAGDEVAAVVADDWHTAKEALGLIKIDWKVLPSFSDMKKAMAAGAADIVGDKKGNRARASTPAKRGNFDSAYASAAVKHEGTYSTSTLHHAYIEPQVAVARWEGPERLIVWESTQYIPGVRANLAAYFDMPRSHVRVICENMGGGFGGKTGANRPGYLAAVLAKMTARPVRVCYERPMIFKSTSHRWQNEMTLKAGVDGSGKIVAFNVSNIGDAAAYSGSNDNRVPPERLYRMANANFENTGVVTNRGASAAMRCVGDPQGTWCQELFIDELAEKAGVDPVKFRLANFETEKYQGNGHPWASCGIVECVEKGAAAVSWFSTWHKPGAKITGRKAHGMGMAAHSCSHGAMSVPTAQIVRLDRDGSLDLNQGLTEIGGGQSTAMMIIAAETIGVELKDAMPGWGDSAFVADTGGTYGSRGTISAGNGVLAASLDLKRQLLERATTPLPPKNAPMLDAKPEDCDTGDGYAFIRANPSKRVKLADIVASTGSPMIGRGAATVPPNYQQGTFSSGFAEVEVDLDTGEITLLRYVASNDVGRVVNRLGIEQQMEGGSSMSMGFGLGEEIVYDPQHNFAVTWNWENYGMPTVLETPKWGAYTPITVESVDAIGPYGAKGVGEPCASPPAPAIANAVYNAIGVRIHDAPLTRDRVLAAIAQMKK